MTHRSSLEVARALCRCVLDHPEGFSWSPTQGAPTTGYMVGYDPADGRFLDLPPDLDLVTLANLVLAHVWANLAFVEADSCRYFGGWARAHEGLRLVVSERVLELEDAVRLGRDRDQESIFQLETRVTIATAR